MSENAIADALKRQKDITDRFLDYVNNKNFDTNTEQGQYQRNTGDVSPAYGFNTAGPGKALSNTQAIPEISNKLGDFPFWWFLDPTGSQSIYKTLFDKVSQGLNQVVNTYVNAAKSLFKPVEVRVGYKGRNPAPGGKISGSTDPFSMNYNPAANWSDGSELYPFYGDPGPIDSRNIQGNQSRYTGTFDVPNVCLALYPENDLFRDIPYYPYLIKNYYGVWRADNSPYGENNAYFENANFMPNPSTFERKGMVYEFLKAAEYQLQQPPVIYQERQENLPYGSLSTDTNNFLDLKTGDTPRRDLKRPVQTIPQGSFDVARRYEIRVNDALWEYSGDTFYVGNPSNGTYRPGTPPSYYSSLSALVTVLSGSDNTLKVPSSRYPRVLEIFAFNETYPMTGYSVYKNGQLLSSNNSLTATYDDSGTNKITVFDFTNITAANPVSIRNNVNTLSGVIGVPTVNSFFENNNIDQGRYGTFMLLEHNGIKSQNIARPFTIVYCNALIPSISGVINIVN